MACAEVATYPLDEHRDGAVGVDGDGELYGDHGQHDAAGRYSPAPMIETIIKIRDGRPDLRHISTSYVERQNPTIRMAIRRFTRLTNAFSKKLDNHKAACALHFAYYNFCRIHKSLRVTPAMEAGITDHIWTIRELLSSANPLGVSFICRVYVAAKCYSD
jgi:hypothetical protein